MTKKIHLICNAHIDPVWLWEWEEGVAEALSTFRTAADLCEEFDGFIFNHNEAILYEWVETYEPALFKRIQKLVGAGQWHIMGGWYVQPDCNMPCGESFVRQSLVGKGYFKEKFGVDVTAAVNLDPFGHTRGLVQILAGSGYKSYLFCRPGMEDLPLPSPEFVWVGYDGSELLATLATAHYNSNLGEARGKVEAWMKARPDQPVSALLWGVGNHGGGPSRIDLRALARLIKSEKNFQISHSTPEQYFRDLGRRKDRLPRREGDLNPWAVGCYTSQIRVKQKYRALENALFVTEKMTAHAAFQGLMEYPRRDLDAACRDMLANTFHDVLPGSSIQPVEEAALRSMDHGLEILSRQRARAFYALSAGQKKARPGEIPVLVYNPHPWKTRCMVECEMQEAQPNESGTFLWPELSARGKALPAQVEKEDSNINQDFRKRVVFAAELEPAAMNRFDCRLVPLPRKPACKVKEKKGVIHFKTRDLDVVINGRTGLVDRYRVKGTNFLAKGAFKALVMADYPDSWGMRVKSFRRKAGAFKLMSRKEGARFSGIEDAALPSVRIIEDGPVRTVVEAVLSHGQSSICQRYKLPKVGTEIEVEVRVFWNEKDRMLKLSIPSCLEAPRYLGQVACGTEPLKDNGDEMVAQKWVALVAPRPNRALTCINDGIYGSDMKDGELRLSLLRSPGHAAHPVLDRLIMEQDRFTTRIDQGERLFRFWIKGGTKTTRMERIHGEAQARNEQPFALAFFPSGQGKKPRAGVQVSDRAVQVMAVKKAEKGSGLIVRLFEPTGKGRKFTLTVPFLGARIRLTLAPFEIKTIHLGKKKGNCKIVNLLER